MEKKKGQAAMEYLQTHAWSILAIFVVLSVLVILIRIIMMPNFCLFDDQTFACSVPTTPIVSRSTGEINGFLRNNLGRPVRLMYATCTEETVSTLRYDIAVPSRLDKPLGDGETVTLQNAFPGLRCYSYGSPVNTTFTVGSRKFKGNLYVWYRYPEEPDYYPLHFSHAALLIDIVDSNFSVCGNGVLEVGEQCDDGTANGVPCTPSYGPDGGCTYCSDSCTIVTLPPVGICGDGIVQAPFEQCENDSHCPLGYVCQNCSCKRVATPVCGNGVLEVGEECDDGTANGVPCTPSYGPDGGCTYCSDSCTIVTLPPAGICGDGIVQAPFEQCENDSHCPLGYVCQNCSCKRVPKGCVDYNNAWDGMPEPFGSDNGMCEDGVYTYNDYCEVCRGESVGNVGLGCGWDHDGICEPQRGEYWGTSIIVKGINGNGERCSGDVPGIPSLDCYPDYGRLTADCDHDGVCEEDQNETPYTCIDCSCTGRETYWDQPIYVDGVMVSPGGILQPWCQRYLGENEITCPEDCGCDHDGTCEIMRGETEENCDDCGCNYNGRCEVERGETSQTCPSDCLNPNRLEVCGNGMCNPYTESYETCPDDCDQVARCGNGKCEPAGGEDKFTCPADCDPVYVCGGSPPCLNYHPSVERSGDIVYVVENSRGPDSCPGCGDGVCKVICGETANSCPSDCVG